MLTGYVHIPMYRCCYRNIVKILKIRTPKIVLKVEVQFYHSDTLPNDIDGITYSVGPDQTGLFNPIPLRTAKAFWPF